MPGSILPLRLEVFEMALPESLEGAFSVLRRAYPEGVPESDYLPLLAFLWDEMSKRALARVVAELTERDPDDVYHDAHAATSGRRPAESDVARVRQLLEANGWEHEELPPSDPGTEVTREDIARRFGGEADSPDA
jgi:hypothetical protein